MTLTGYALVFASIVGLPFGLGALFAVFVAMASAVALELVAFRPVRRASGATMIFGFGTWTCPPGEQRRSVDGQI